MGGYFATRCKHHQSVARIFAQATVTPATPDHPVSRGWREFTFHDEPYIKNYFGPNENKLADGVAALATSMLPPEAPEKQIVAWGIQRADGGRGMGVVMPHFYRNWKLEDLRRMILNGIVWTAGLDVPAGGVQTSLPDLAVFEPDAVEPLSSAPKKPKAEN
jgi:type 1 glutamine amidotransferase